jgi:hypothetical protein
VTTALQLAFAKPQVFAELQALGEAVQGFLAHQVGPQAGHVALAQLTEALEQGDRGDAVEHAVTEKLQPLVVGRTEAAMGDRLLEQLGRKTMAMAIAQRRASCALPSDLRRGRTEIDEQTHVTEQRPCGEYSMDMTMRPSSLVMSTSEAVMVVMSSTMGVW